MTPEEFERHFNRPSKPTPPPARLVREGGDPMTFVVGLLLAAVLLGLAFFIATRM